MSSLSDGEDRELCQRALRMAYRDGEPLMGSIAGLRFAAIGYDDDLERVAAEALKACRPIHAWRTGRTRNTKKDLLPMPRHKILVVEDERIVVKDIQATLERLGYSITGAVASGEEAITMARHNHPDLVLMDIVLKGPIDGIEAAQKIREELDIPVIYMTANADEETFERAKLTEPFGYVRKPFEKRELHAMVKMALLGTLS